MVSYEWSVLVSGPNYCITGVAGLSVCTRYLASDRRIADVKTLLSDNATVDWSIRYVSQHQTGGRNGRNVDPSYSSGQWC